MKEKAVQKETKAHWDCGKAFELSERILFWAQTTAISIVAKNYQNMNGSLKVFTLEVLRQASREGFS